MVPKLHILAYCEEMIPILAEVALDCGYTPLFTVIENIPLEKGRYPIDVPEVAFEFIRKKNWVATGNENVALSVVQPGSKQKVFLEFLRDCNLQQENYPDLIHPSCFVSKTAKTNGGLIMEPLSVISSHSTIGFGVTIGHHGSVGDFVSINPGVNIGGKVHIGERATIGIGAVILDGISIGPASFIGAGSIVTRDIPPGVVAFGSPCKVVREIAS